MSKPKSANLAQGWAATLFPDGRLHIWNAELGHRTELDAETTAKLRELVKDA